MKCKKCGNEIIESIGYCVSCKTKEEMKYNVESYISDFYEIPIIKTTNNKYPKYNNIRFYDDGFCLNFDYNKKPIDTSKIFVELMYGTGLFAFVGFVYYMSLRNNCSNSLLILYISLGLFFLAVLFAFIPLYVNPSVNICYVDINKKCLKLSYSKYKTNQEDFEESGVFKVSVDSVHKLIEQIEEVEKPKKINDNKIEIEIPKENISKIKIRRIYDIENEHIISNGLLDYQNKEEHYYAFYVCFVNPIYIYDEKKKYKKTEKKEKIKLEEIRLISHIFSESVDLENIKNEFENELGLTKK